tara:strand:+ start:6705 stop:6968 length:264 start_codon:yes stop_codon:yes gene_type:complete
MSWAEYCEWRLYETIEPFGGKRADINAAMVAAASQAPHVKNPADIEDFLIFTEDRFDPEPSEEEQWQEWDDVLDRAAARAARAEKAK